MPDDFKMFLKLLKKHEVEYLLVGGYAVVYYGYPRATNDIDFWIATDSTNASKMVSVLHDFGFDEGVDETLFFETHKMTRLGYPPIRIEILTQIDGVTFRDCYARRVLTKIDGIEINIIGLEDLKKNKKASGRYKDLDDLENLTFKT